MSTERLVVWERVDAIDSVAWDALLRPGGDFYMDRRFLRAVERSMSETTRLWYLLVRDDAGRTVATAVMSLFKANAALLAEGSAAVWMARLERVSQSLVTLPMLFCGVPLSGGQSHLRVSAETDRASVVATLEDWLWATARKARARVIVWKEFGPAEEEWLGPALAGRGYRRADSLPMNHAPTGPASFDEYLASLKSRKRSVLKRSRRAFAESGLTVEQRTGGAETAALYTDEVHRLYEHVLSNAKVRLERLPASLFRELAREMGDDVLFTFVREGERIVGMACSAKDGDEFHQVFVGYDPDVNERVELYFNLFYEAIDRGFRLRPVDLSVGQSADDFKAQKLSCTQTPLWFYVRGVDVVTRLALWLAFEEFCPPHALRATGDEPAEETPGAGTGAG